MATGCASKLATKVEVQYVVEPEVYQHTLPKPVPPAAGASNAEWGDYIVDLNAWGDDAAHKVLCGAEWVKTRLNPAHPFPKECQ